MDGRLDGYLPKAVLQVISTCLFQKVFSLGAKNRNIYKLSKKPAVPLFMDDVLKIEAAVPSENM